MMPPFIFRLVGCLLFSPGLCFWPLFAWWMVFRQLLFRLEG